VADEDGEEALAAWSELAMAGDRDAMVKLGLLLEGSDPISARRWCERAADLSGSTAMFRLGPLLMVSEPAVAAVWLERAAELGDAKAMTSFGVLLEDSDPAGARRWYERAAELGELFAMDNLGLLPSGRFCRDPATRIPAWDYVIGCRLTGSTSRPRTCYPPSWLTVFGESIPIPLTLVRSSRVCASGCGW
jgi:TPR repeat protein